MFTHTPTSTSPSPRGFAFTCPRVETLAGQGAVLWCDHCQHDVHDLSALTRSEALSVIATHHAPCVRLTVAVDGHVVFRPPAPVAPSFQPRDAGLGSTPRRARIALVGALAGALAAGPAVASPCEPLVAPCADASTGDGAMSLMATAVNRLAALIAHAEADAARLRAAAQSPAVQPAQYPNAIRDDMVIGGAINTQPYPAAQLVQPAQSESVTDAPESPQPAP